MSWKNNHAAAAQEGRNSSACSPALSETPRAPILPGLDAPIVLDTTPESFSHKGILPTPSSTAAGLPLQAPPQEGPEPSRRIRCIDLFITRTGPLVDPERGDYRVVLQLSFGSAIRQSSVLIPYTKAPHSWDTWSQWFQPFAGVRCDEAMSVLYYDAEWISDYRDRLLRLTLEPSTEERTLFPATAFWRRNALVESSDIHICITP